jgi:hypothetical protein
MIYPGTIRRTGATAEFTAGWLGTSVLGLIGSTAETAQRVALRDTEADEAPGEPEVIPVVLTTQARSQKIRPSQGCRVLTGPGERFDE